MWERVVVQAPTITQQPANANICAGGNATFTVGPTARAR